MTPAQSPASEPKPPSPEAEPTGGGKIDPRLAAAESLLGDLTTQVSRDQQFITQATMDAKARTANIHKRVGDEKDDDVGEGKSIGDRLFEAKDDNEIVALTASEAESLGLDPVNGQAQTKVQLVYTLNQQLGRMNARGDEDIFTPSTQISNIGLRQEGERRIAGEKRYVQIQAGLYQYARRLTQADRFNEAIGMADRVSRNLDDAPDWFMKDFVIGVIKADLGDRTKLEAVASLVTTHALQPANEAERKRILGAEKVTDLTSLEQVWRKAQEAQERLTNVRKQEAEQRRLREEAERAEAKKRTHKERLANLEDDTYKAAIEAGRQIVTKIGENGRDRNNVNVNIGSAEQPDNFTIPFSMIFRDERFLRALQANGLSSDNSATPVAQLRALQIIAEDQDVFESVVQTLANNSTVDRTGYSLADYQADGREADWLNNWRASLRRMVDGYALGVVQGAAEYEIPEQANQQWGRASNLELSRSDAVTAAFEVLFNEKNILDKTHWDKLDPFEVTALLKIGQYRQALMSDPARLAMSARMEEFLTGKPLRDAVSNAVRTKEGILAARKQMLEQEEKVTQAITKVRGELDSALAALNDFRRGGGVAIRSYIDKLAVLQLPQEIKTWLAVDRKNKLQPQLAINVKTRERLTGSITNLKEKMAQLKGRDDEPSHRQLIELNFHLEGYQAELDFIARLEQELNTINNQIHVDYRGALRGGDRGQFNAWGFPTEGWGKVEEVVRPYYERQLNQLFGKDGTLAKIEAEDRRLRASLEKKGITLEERQRVQKDLERLQQQAKDAGAQMGRFREQINLNEGIAYAAKRFLAQDVKTQLQTDGLLYEGN